MNPAKDPKIETTAYDSAKPSRRSFLRRGVAGAWLFGLGSAMGLLANRTPKGAGQAPRTGRTLGKEFAYGLEQPQRTDPKLIGYQEIAAIPTGLKELRAVTVADGNVYAAGDRAVIRFGKNSARLQALDLAEAPRCLAVGSGGRVFVGFKDHVESFAPNGTRIARWESAGPKAVLTSIAVAGSDVFVADAGDRIVLRYDGQGTLRSRIGKKDTARNIPGFIVPSPYFDLAIGPGPLLWVANPGRHRLEAYTLAGDFESSWGEASFGMSGFCGCCNPAHFALLPDGRFVTSEKGITRVKVYSARGEFESVVAGPELFSGPNKLPDAGPLGLDVAVDEAEQILVADRLRGAVRRFSRLTEKQSDA